MGPLRTPKSMRSDERLFFYVAAGLMLVSIVYTLGWHIFPLYEEHHNYVYGHCTVTGRPHWEKYDTLGGISERVVMPVELRIGDWENAMNFAAKKNKDILESIDVYHQGIARDSPSGWQYFSPEDKKDFLEGYSIGKEFECWSRPSTGYREIVFHTDERDMPRLFPQILFLIMVLGLCLATGVCVGVVDMLRICIGLPPGAEDDTYADEDFAQRKYGTAEKRFSGAVGPGVEGGGDMRRFASERYAEDKGWA